MNDYYMNMDCCIRQWPIIITPEAETFPWARGLLGLDGNVFTDSYYI